MTPIEIYIIVMIAVGAVIGIGYAYRIKQQRQAKAAALALDRENVQKAKDRLNNARLIRLQEKEKIKQWWANPISTTTDTTVDVYCSPELEQSRYSSSYDSSSSDSSSSSD
jgi:LPS O-antigen subunit length determinant protein (WzzB/FepE family)